MTTTKRIFACLLAMTMLVPAAVCGGVSAWAEDLKPVTLEPTDIDNQLAYIFSQIGTLKQDDSQNPWYYTITDLDHDGNLEFVSASQHPQDRSTNLKVWEVSNDRKALVECKLDKDPEESFPDILTDVADTFHDTATDTWNYLFYDNVVICPTDVYTSKSAYNLKDGVISYQAYAVEHTQIVNGVRSVSHTDASGAKISPEQYNAAGNNAFANAERSSTNFEWLTAADVNNLTRVIDSYAVFSGRKNPTEVFPVPKPEALTAPTATPAPTAVPTPAPTPTPVQPIYLSITKNPTNENKTEGGTAYFVSCANAYESLTWTFVGPDGGEYSVQNFRNIFGASVSGEYSTTLAIDNVSTSMNNWGAYCTFYYQGQTARTTTAYMYVTAKSKPAPSGTYTGTVTDWNYSSVTIWAENTVSISIPFGKCDIDGDLYVGAYASFNWNGSEVTYCYISGNKPSPTPQYGSMSGTAYESGGGFTINLANGVSLYVDGWKCNVYGNFYDGASCVAYYSGSISNASVYSVDIYGSEQVGPVYGDMSGYAYEGGGGYAINLSNGTQIYVDGWKCNVSGTFYDGAPCTVTYMNYPSSDNVTSVAIYGSSDPILDQGGWAGSHYYDTMGGYAGSNYYDNQYYYDVDDSDYINPYVYADYDPIGDEYNRVECPNCGNHFSVGYNSCPVCGWTP